MRKAAFPYKSFWVLQLILKSSLRVVKTNIMSQKRPLLPPAYQNKRRRVEPEENSGETEESSGEGSSSVDGALDLPSDSKATLMLLRSLFPVEKFDCQIPPVMFVHQLYSIVANRTTADKQLDELRQSFEVHLFKLGQDINDTCVVFTDDYVAHVRNYAKTVSTVDTTVLDKFLSKVIQACPDLSVNKRQMMSTFSFTDNDISHLIKAGVLTVRDVGSWWLAIPGAGIFTKSFYRGRKAVLTMIEKSKYKEIMQKELQNRKLPKIAKLGMTYHIHDLLGADLVESISTTSGNLLRLKD